MFSCTEQLLKSSCLLVCQSVLPSEVFCLLKVTFTRVQEYNFIVIVVTVVIIVKVGTVVTVVTVVTAVTKKYSSHTHKNHTKISN